MSSIYTIFLLGYLGVFDSVVLDQFIEVSHKLQTYINTYRKVWGEKQSVEELKIMNLLHDELIKSLNSNLKLKTHG